MEVEIARNRTKKDAKEYARIYHSFASKGKKCKDIKASTYAKILTLFKSSDNFKIVFEHSTFRQLNGHELHGDRKNQWSLDFGHPLRFVFRLIGEYDKSNVPAEYEKIKKIEIIEFVDYH